MKVHSDEDINISSNVTIVYLTSVYTQTHAYDCCVKISGMGEVVDISCFEKDQQMTKFFMDRYVSKRIILDDRGLKIRLSPIDAKGILGEVNDDNITIKKRIIYKTPYPLDVREHVMQIMLRSGITQYRITLPEGTKLELTAGMENVSGTEIGSHVVLNASYE